MNTLAGQARPALTIQHQATLSALWLGLNFQSSALLPIVVPAQVLLLIDRGAVASANQALAVSALSLAAAVIAVVVTPLAGAASDRLKTRFGRRRQLIVAGVLVAVVGQAGLAVTIPLLVFIAGFVIVQVGTNVATAAYQGLLPDLVKVSQRGAASGWLGFMTLLGSVGSLAAAGVLLGNASPGPSLAAEVTRGSLFFYAAAALVLVLCAAVTVIGVDEKPAATVPPAHSWRDLFGHQPFRIVFGARALVMIGLTLFLTYIEYYLAATNDATAFVGATVAIALLALFGALASTWRWGSHRTACPASASSSRRTSRWRRPRASSWLPRRTFRSRRWGSCSASATAPT